MTMEPLLAATRRIACTTVVQRYGIEALFAQSRSVEAVPCCCPSVVGIPDRSCDLIGGLSGGIFGLLRRSGRSSRVLWACGAAFLCVSDLLPR